MPNPTSTPARTRGRLREEDALMVAGDGSGMIVADLKHRGRGHANAAHLAACWNLVEDLGGDVEAVRRAVRAAEEFLSRVDDLTTDEFRVGRERPERESLRAALAALGRRG